MLPERLTRVNVSSHRFDAIGKRFISFVAMSTRRGFLRQLGAALGGGLALGRLRPQGAGVRVSPGRALPVELPGVRIDYLRLRMPDGAHLAATLYLPEDASPEKKVPVILEVLPYRKDDGYLGRDLRNHGFYARHGYAGLRLDVRGTGASEGVPEDEYSVKEHEDTLIVIDWLSRQPWSNGNVGMTGISYGAFNSLQIAAMNPPALKAIVAVAGTDDRYTDDVHYIGGALHLFENTWAVGMISSNIFPAAPDFDLETTAARDRFEAPPWILRWLHEQTDGPYWRRGSLRPDYGRLRIPTYVVGGWLDGYHNFVPRIMRHAPAVTKGLVGPWPHAYPHRAHPGPSIDFRNQFLLRWWEQWLKGRETGILREPRLTGYSMRAYEPALRLPDLPNIPGEWWHLDDWPETAFNAGERLFLRPAPEDVEEASSDPDRPGQGGSLSSRIGRASALRLRYRPGVGTASKTWAPNGDGSYGLDQRSDDVWGLAFDTAPLRDPVDILGFGRARLFVSATAPVANWIVRLCDVAPDGTSVYVSKGVLNGTHRRSHTDPEPLVPGEVVELAIELHATAWRFARGHRIRLVVTNADWPVVWPSPYPMRTTLYSGGDRPSHVDLPVWTPRSASGPELRPGPDEEPLPGLAYESAPIVWQVSRDEAAGTATFRFERGSKTLRHPAGFTGEDGQVMIARVSDWNPANASLEVESFEVARGGGRMIEARGEGALRASAGEFAIELHCRLFENGKLRRERRWEDRAPRRGV